MATLDTLSEQILRILGERTDDKSIDIRDVKLNVVQSLAYVVRARYFESKQDEQEIIDGTLISIFKNQEISTDVDTGSFYTQLPCDVISLPYGGGIRFVSPTKDTKVHFKQVQHGFCDLYRGLDSQNLENQIGYYVEQDKIYYVNLTNCDDIETVRMGILVGMPDLNTDPNFRIPMDMEYDIVREVLKVYGAWAEDDITNNTETKA